MFVYVCVVTILVAEVCGQRYMRTGVRCRWDTCSIVATEQVH